MRLFLYMFLWLSVLSFPLYAGDAQDDELLDGADSFLKKVKPYTKDSKHYEADKRRETVKNSKKKWQAIVLQSKKDNESKEKKCKSAKRQLDSHRERMRDGYRGSSSVNMNKRDRELNDLVFSSCH